METKKRGGSRISDRGSPDKAGALAADPDITFLRKLPAVFGGNEEAIYKVLCKAPLKTESKRF